MGNGTPFEGMSHEAMLSWLDQANSGTVQGAADRLLAASKEIRKIADDLKVRPQWVDWKGAGADAFRTWTADLANATLRLGDFSEGSSTWLGHASDAIASAQAAIPRDKPGAEGNLAAAQKAHNDPDAAAISRKSTAELAALEADKEKVRQEAVAQMRKLGQAYQQSATQMNGLERPRFPPPPQSIVPEHYDAKGSAKDRPDSSPVTEGSSSSGAADPGHPAQTQASASGSSDATSHLIHASSTSPTLGNAQQPSKLDIDSVATLPHTAPTPSPPGIVPVPPPVPSGDMSTVRIPPTALGGELRVPPGPTGPGRSTAGENPLVRPGGQTASGRNPARIPDSSPGITGGRPTPAPEGRPSGSIPRGTVVGAGEGAGRGAAGQVTGTGLGGQTTGRPAAGFGRQGMASGSPGVASGRRFSSASGGVSGGSAQQSGRVGGRSSASAGAHAERGGISGGRPVGGTPSGAPGKGPRDSKEARQRREGVAGYLVEDEETWQQGARRAVPPVID
ncbi:translation initiation factor IF-2 [Streptomyces sp. NPDC007172]|uniref:translation initiation factor IF-2 n=1 Tax=Streptomyces sp. NPDC007172 TaxID=3364776 RepID=UPI00369B66A8